MTTTSAPGGSIGERIRYLREQRRLTPGQLVALAQQHAPAAAFARSTLWRLENDERRPETHILTALALALATSTDFILGLTPDPAPLHPSSLILHPLPTASPTTAPLIARLDALPRPQRAATVAALLALLDALAGFVAADDPSALLDTSDAEDAET